MDIKPLHAIPILQVTVNQDKRTIGSISIPVGSVSDAGTQVQWFKVKSAEVIIIINSQAPLPSFLRHARRQRELQGWRACHTRPANFFDVSHTRPGRLPHPWGATSCRKAAPLMSLHSGSKFHSTTEKLRRRRNCVAEQQRHAWELRDAGMG